MRPAAGDYPFSKFLKRWLRFWNRIMPLRHVLYENALCVISLLGKWVNRVREGVVKRSQGRYLPF
jgi:hypothetical protein